MKNMLKEPLNEWQDMAYPAERETEDRVESVLLAICVSVRTALLGVCPKALV